MSRGQSVEKKDESTGGILKEKSPYSGGGGKIVGNLRIKS